jgi:multisubunit Na+/H+ antiporter MnhE subunit
MLKSRQFWLGVIVGYLILVVFPQFNVRSMAVKKG